MRYYFLSISSITKFFPVFLFLVISSCTCIYAQKVKPVYENAFIPTGFIETKNLVFFELDKQGSVGTVEKVITQYNKYIAGKRKGHDNQAVTKSNLIDDKGEPFDWRMRMDIIHPEKPSAPRPVFFIVSTSTKRNIDRHSPFQQIFAKRGYVTVIIDHAYNPMAYAFGHHDAYYSLDDITGVKAYTAAIRYLRANAKKYSIDPNFIGGLGHSKGSYAITRLSDPTINSESSENFTKIKSYSPQTNTEYPSHIQVGYQSMGNGTRRSKKYVNANYAPTITAVGKWDEYNQWAAWPDVVAAYSTDHDANWLGIPMLDKGHNMASGFQPDKGYMREKVVEQFFANYLEPNLPPNVLYVTPYNGLTNENIVTADQPVAIHFSPQIDFNSVKEFVQVVSEPDKKTINGTWKAMRKNTYFLFTPEGGKFKNKQSYTVIINPEIKSVIGIPLGKKLEYQFKVTD